MTGKRNDVVYKIALAGAFACTSGRTGVLLLELNFGGLAAFDPGIGNLAGHVQRLSPPSNGDRLPTVCPSVQSSNADRLIEPYLGVASFARQQGAAMIEVPDVLVI